MTRRFREQIVDAGQGTLLAAIRTAHPQLHGHLVDLEAAAGQRTNSEMDLAMLVIYGGRERRIDELRTLALEFQLGATPPVNRPS